MEWEIYALGLLVTGVGYLCWQIYGYMGSIAKKIASLDLPALHERLKINSAMEQENYKKLTDAGADFKELNEKFRGFGKILEKAPAIDTALERIVKKKDVLETMVEKLETRIDKLVDKMNDTDIIACGGEIQDWAHGMSKAAKTEKENAELIKENAKVRAENEKLKQENKELAGAVQVVRKHSPDTAYPIETEGESGEPNETPG